MLFYSNYLKIISIFRCNYKPKHKTMLKTARLQRYRNDQHIQFNNDLDQIITDSDPVILNVKQQHDDLKEGNAEMEAVYKTLKASELTDKITAEDDVRDNLIAGIEKLADGFTHHFETDHTDAAKLILMHTGKYGTTIARLKYQAETTALNDLIDSSKNDSKLNAAVSLLSLNQWFVKLEESNNRFKNLFMVRVKDNAEKPDAKLKDLRKESIVQYKELAKHLESHAVVTPSALYTKVIKEINQLIDKYNMM